MRLSSLMNPRKRTRYIKRAIKKAKWLVKSSSLDTLPVFVFGMQRSGTTMFMDIMENRPDMEVFQEWNRSVFGNDCRVDDFSLLDKAITSSKASYACFKPICDSHRVLEFISNYPDSIIFWVYRSYLDNANSAIRRFPHSDRSLRLICEGKPGGGWLEEGISDDVLGRLKKVYNEKLSGFEISCLNWWVRNIVFVQNHLADSSNTYLIKYEALVRDPFGTFRSIESLVGLPLIKKSYSAVHDRSISKNEFPPVSDGIRELCEQLSSELDVIWQNQSAAGPDIAFSQQNSTS